MESFLLRNSVFPFRILFVIYSMSLDEGSPTIVYTALTGTISFCQLFLPRSFADFSAVPSRRPRNSTVLPLSFCLVHCLVSPSYNIFLWVSHSGYIAIPMLTEMYFLGNFFHVGCIRFLYYFLFFLPR